MSLVMSLLSIAARGGLKVSFMLLTISLFTGLIVAVQSMSHSYANEALILKEISRSPRLAVSHKPMTGESLRVEVATIRLNSHIVILVAPEDVGRYIALHGSRVDGECPGKGEILVGERLKPLLQGGGLTVQGKLLNVSGFILAPTHLSSAILLTMETMRTLRAETTTLYYEEAVEPGMGLAEAPSSASLIQAVTEEVLGILTQSTLLLYIVLALTCMIQGYNAAHESRRALKVFLDLGASRGRMAASLCVLSFAVSSGGVALGHALGTIASALSSSLISIALGLPYIRPTASLHLIYWLGLAFATSSMALASGLVRGYSSVDSG